MENLDNKSETSFYLRFLYTYRLKNLATGAIILYHKNTKGSPWLQYLEAPAGEEIQPKTARAWLSAEEESRSSVNNIERPNTRWIFFGLISV